jgi:hypothetical protein
VLPILGALHAHEDHAAGEAGLQHVEWRRRASAPALRQQDLGIVRAKRHEHARAAVVEHQDAGQVERRDLRHGPAPGKARGEAGPLSRANAQRGAGISAMNRQSRAQRFEADRTTQRDRHQSQAAEQRIIPAGIESRRGHRKSRC